MLIPYLVIILVSLLLTALGIFKPQAMRIFFGIFFLVMALGVNLSLVLINPGLYVDAGRDALLPIYKWFFTVVLAWNPPVFVSLLILFETCVGVLILSKGRPVKLGLLAATIFTIVITPIGLYTLTNPIFAVPMAILLRKEYDFSLLDGFKNQFRKMCLICGLIAPVLYVGTVICGAALYPGYSHVVNAISELLSYGAPNKAVLDVIFNVYGALLLLFAIGATLALRRGPRLCRAAMGLFIAIQIISFSWGFFPMDPIGTAPTFAGTMHNVFGGVVALASILMPLLMGLGLRRNPGMRSYSLYALISAAVIFISGLAGVVLSSQGIHLFGLFERVTIGTYEVWIFVTALMMVKGNGDKSFP